MAIIQVVPAVTRIHVGALEWDKAATDFWINANNAIAPVGASTAVAALAAYGWTATSVLYTNTATGDFGSAADMTPSNYGANANADILVSPRVFGDNPHMTMVSKILGYQPTRLVFEAFAAFTTASANEAATFLGWDSGALVGGIYSGGTASTFFLSNATPTTDAGAAIDTAYHLWRMEVDATNMVWYMDGTNQGTVVTSTDLWPCSFAWRASTTNRIALAWAHCWYE